MATNTPYSNIILMHVVDISVNVYKVEAMRVFRLQLYGPADIAAADHYGAHRSLQNYLRMIGAGPSACPYKCITSCVVQDDSVAELPWIPHYLTPPPQYRMRLGLLPFPLKLIR